ncbi:MAG: adenylate/guanylate cyclase domain-containing protein [Hyphomicrobiales bacterium]
MPFSADFEHDATAWLTGPAMALPNVGEVWNGLWALASKAGVSIESAVIKQPAIHPSFTEVHQIWVRDEPWQLWYVTHAGRGLIDHDSLFPASTPSAVSDTRARNLKKPAIAEEILLSTEKPAHHEVIYLNDSSGDEFGVRLVWPEDQHPDEGELEVLNHLLPVLMTVLELKMVKRRFGLVLATYAGERPARRILDGQIKRGDVEHIYAAMLMCDLRGFTERAIRLSSEELVARLNDYFDVAVPEILKEGGEVLKFMGDGILAIFPSSNTAETNGEACNRALRAANNMHAAFKSQAPASGESTSMDAVVALHFGDVAFGNIGAGGRQDFTVIGRDVNLVSRIEPLCKQLNEATLMSEEFAIHVGSVTEELGEFSLKGFVQARRVYRPA